MEDREMTVYLIWLMVDDREPMLVGVADTMDKAVLMRSKLEETRDKCGYCIQEFKKNTVTINEIDYTF